MKKMLINATLSEELRVAIVEGQNLLDVIVDRQSYRTRVGNIYLAKVTTVEQSLDASFVNFGSERHGFLPMKEISKEYFEKIDHDKVKNPNIRDYIKPGQYLMVQVEKEERGNKGAALTTFISLAGSYLVLMPNNPRAGGISRRVEGEERDELREILDNLPLPEGMGIIVRTAGVGKSAEELGWDLNNLLRQWDAIKMASLERDPPFLIHQESDVVTRIIRDHLREDFDEILIDNPDLFEQVKTHIEQVRPDFLNKIKLYSSDVPIFNHYQVEQKIESAYQRSVQLPSGGSIVIDHTEALVAVDVNSARSTKGSHIEETATTTNVEAAEEIARQLKLRDLGGLVVIDFIDMSAVRNRKLVETSLRTALKMDKARTQVGSISSRFGLLEMSRQRLRHSLGEATQVVCPRCSGWGTIRGIESLTLSIIRLIEDNAVRQNVGQVQAQLPVDISTYVINEKREMISSIEKRHNVEILIIPNPNLESPHYHIKRVSKNELPKSGRSKPSHLLVEQADTNTLYQKTEEASLEEKPAVGQLLPEQAAPSKKAGTGIIKRFIGSLFNATEETATPASAAPSKPAATRTSRPNKPRQPQRSRGPHPKKGKPQTGSSTQRTRTRTPASPKRDKQPENVQEVKQETGNVKAAATKTDTKTGIKPSTKVETKSSTNKVDTTVDAKSETKTDTRPRTRRGSRGGRRRNNPNPSSTGNPGNPTDTGKTETPPEMPPFPTDLEDYYKSTSNPSRQRQKTNVPDKKPAAMQVTETKPATAAPDKSEKNLVQTPPTPKPLPISTSTIETEKPLIIKPTPIEPKKQVEKKPVKKTSDSEDGNKG